MISIKLFAGIAEKLARSEVTMDKEEVTVAQLVECLQATYPELSEDLGRAMIAVNEEFVSSKAIVRSADTVAIIPPVSGG